MVKGKNKKRKKYGTRVKSTPDKRTKEKFSPKNTFGFLLLTCFLLLFYTFMIYEAAVHVKMILYIVVLLLADGLFFVKSKLELGRQKIGRGMKELTAVTAAAIVTFVVSVEGLGPVIAAAAVGLLYSTVSERFGRPWKILSAPVYCGAFVGMSFKPAYTDLWMVALAGLAAGLVYFVTDRVFEGVGGKLGTVAFIGSLGIKILMVFLGL